MMTADLNLKNVTTSLDDEMLEITTDARMDVSDLVDRSQGLQLFIISLSLSESFKIISFFRFKKFNGSANCTR
jgi:hypothetical protein